MSAEFFYPTAFQKWDDEERAAMARVIASGRFTMGAEVEAFEAEFAAAHCMKYAVMVNSGSSANLVAVAALFHKQERPLRSGYVARVPALAWSTTYAPLVQHGMRLFLADCGEDWNSCPEAEGFVDLVMACSILGNPAKVSRSRGGYVIEDNCESLWASVDNRFCGTRGDLNTFSFFWSHQLSAIEGGMVLTDDPELAMLCRMLRAHGWSRDVEKPLSFGDEYDFRLFGYNLRPLEMHAAIGREQLKKLNEFRDWRRRNRSAFIEATAGLSIIHQAERGISNPFGMAFRVDSFEVRDKLVSAFRTGGVDCRLPTGGSFRRHEYGRPWRDQQTPVADLIHDTGLFIGNAPFDISDRIERAANIMRRTI